MRLIQTVTASCIVALLAGCATSRRADKEDDNIVVTASRVDESSAGSHNQNVPPPPPPPPVAVVSAPPPVSPAPLRQEAYKAMDARGRIAGNYIAPVMVPADPGNERYDGKEVSPVHNVKSEPVSTFSVDVDTGAYANTRRFLTAGQLPPKDAVRSEELINYFRYDYARPESRGTPFSVTTDVAITPWNPQTRLLRIGLKGYDLPRSARPAANLVFLIDVSGSMSSPDKLPLVKTALAGLASELSPRDKVYMRAQLVWCWSQLATNAKSALRWSNSRQADRLLAVLACNWPIASLATT
jgi:Ca-activated chloride channel homolog